MFYRTRVYIAGDWDGDQDAIQKLKEWNEGERWGLSFSDAHDLMQARDSSLNCSIKKSLAQRMNGSKTFILVVGNKTASVRSGSCGYGYCPSKNLYTGACARGYAIDNRSYVEYECEKAKNDGLNIFVLYNSCRIDKQKCPSALRNIGVHIPMRTVNNNYDIVWNYNEIYSKLKNFV